MARSPSSRCARRSCTTAEQRQIQTALSRRARRVVHRDPKRLGELQRADPPERDRRDHRLVPADHDLRLDSLPVAVRGADPADDRQRRADRARGLLALGARGLRRDGGGVPHDHRLLDLRHDHRLRPRAREPPAHAPRRRSPRSSTRPSGRPCGGRWRRRSSRSLPVGALFFFGGDTLKDFAFAILIGIGISAFSTLFIAAPFLAVLLEKAPEYKRQAMQRRRGREAGRVGRHPRAGRAGARYAGGGCGGHRRTARGAPLGERGVPARASSAAPQRSQAARPRTLTLRASYTWGHERPGRRRAAARLRAPARRHRLRDARPRGGRRARGRPGAASGRRSRRDARRRPRHAAGVARRGRPARRAPRRGVRAGVAKAGLVRREEMDDLALRVAQLEHRIRLLEHDPAKVAH